MGIKRIVTVFLLLFVLFSSMAAYAAPKTTDILSVFAGPESSEIIIQYNNPAQKQPDENTVDKDIKMSVNDSPVEKTVKKYEDGFNYIVIVNSVNSTGGTVNGQLGSIIGSMKPNDRICFIVNGSPSDDGFVEQEKAKGSLTAFLAKITANGNQKNVDKDSTKEDRSSQAVKMLKETGEKMPGCLIYISDDKNASGKLQKEELADEELEANPGIKWNMLPILETNSSKSFPATELAKLSNSVYAIDFKYDLKPEGTPYTIKVSESSVQVAFRKSPTNTTSPVATGKPETAKKDNPSTGILAFFKNPVKIIIGILAVLILAMAAFYLFVMRRGSSKIGKTRQDSKGMTKPRGLWFGNAQHIGRREEQQDSFGISDIQNTRLMEEKGVLAVVADGMGGLENGKESSGIVVSTMLDEFAKTRMQSSIPQELRNMVNLANDRVYGASMANSQTMSGSTVVSVVIKGSQLYWVSVGDSRIYLYRNNRITQLTRDHVYGTLLDEDVLRGKISREEAQSNPDRKALVSYIGKDSISEVDQNYTPFQLCRGDRIILCSDGIYGSIDEQEMEEFMHKEPYVAAEEAVKRVLFKNFPGQDNMTIVVIGYD